MYLMQNLLLEETILAKHGYEGYLTAIGVTAKAYHADNGHFADKGFCDECTSSNQVITFCGVGSHHQHRIAEQKIKELTLVACTLLLHAKRMLPEYISTIMWPFALKCAEDKLKNLVHHTDGQTPYQTIAGLDSTKIKMSDFHTFGCPCYVLDHRLQSGTRMIPKWEPRARMGIYVGRSPTHASNVALILNPRTGHGSLQFHVVFDGDFTTVQYLWTTTVPPHWADLMRSLATIQTYTEHQVGTWQLLPEIEREEGNFSGIQKLFDTSTQGSEGASSRNVQLQHNNQNIRVSFLDKPEPVEIEINPPQATNTNSQNMWQMSQSVNLNTSRLRCSSRTEVLNRRDKVYSNMATLSNAPLQLASKRCFKSALVIFASICTVGNGLKSIAHSLQEEVTITLTTKSALSNATGSYHWVNTLYDGTINCFSTVTQSSIASSKTFTYKKAMSESDYHEFFKAMVKEVDDHESRNHWTVMQPCNMPSDTKTIISIWSFKRKCYPDGTLNKHKARLCAHGRMQTWGQNYWETYAPVVNWASNCLILAIAKIHGLSLKSIDFVFAFPQADLEIPLFMELPIGFDTPNNEERRCNVLKLNKSLYGLKQAGYTWFAKLSNGLQD